MFGLKHRYYYALYFFSFCAPILTTDNDYCNKLLLLKLSFALLEIRFQYSALNPLLVGLVEKFEHLPENPNQGAFNF